MCPQINSANVSQLNDNETTTRGKQDTTGYKGRRGRLCGSHSAKPWRIQGGPSIYGGHGDAQQR